VKGLRIEFRREIDDRRFVDAIGAGSKNLALEKIGEFHDRCIRNPLLARASPGARAGLVSWHYAARRKKQSRRALCQASPVAGRGCAASVGTRSAGPGRAGCGPSIYPGGGEPSAAGGGDEVGFVYFRHLGKRPTAVNTRLNQPANDSMPS